VFPDVAFDDNADWSSIWRSIFEESLQYAGETSLWTAAAGERYRLLTSAGGPGGVLLRVEADSGELVAKQVNVAPVGWVVAREFRRPLVGWELIRLRRLVVRTGFWELPTPNPRYNLGLDGTRYLVEARVGERYHLVQRWSPYRGDFARLCRYFESLYWSVVVPRRSWWRLWW
jgi:hypothetical protein